MSSDVSVQKIACEQFCILASGVALQKSKARSEHPAQLFLLLSVRTGAGLELAGVQQLSGWDEWHPYLLSHARLYLESSSSEGGTPPEQWASRRGNVDGELT